MILPYEIQKRRLNLYITIEVRIVLTFGGVGGGSANDWQGAVRGFCGLVHILHFDLNGGHIGMWFSKIDKAVLLRFVYFILYLIKNEKKK